MTTLPALSFGNVPAQAPVRFGMSDADRDAFEVMLKSRLQGAFAEVDENMREDDDRECDIRAAQTVINAYAQLAARPDSFQKANPNTAT